MLEDFGKAGGAPLQNLQNPALLLVALLSSCHSAPVMAIAQKETPKLAGSGFIDQPGNFSRRLALREFPALAGQGDVSGDQGRAAAIAGDGAPGHAQFPRGIGQRQVVDGHPAPEVIPGHDFPRLLQRQPVERGRGHFHVIPPSDIETPFTDRNFPEKLFVHQWMQHDEVIDMNIHVHHQALAVVEGDAELVAVGQDFHGGDADFQGHGLTSLILFVPDLHQQAGVFSGPCKSLLQCLGIGSTAQHAKVINRNQGLTIRRLHMEMRRSVIVRVNTDFPIAVAVYGSHERKDREFFSLSQGVVRELFSLGGAFGKNLLTGWPVAGYAGPATAHSVVGFGRPDHEAHNRAQAVFLCVFFSRARVMAGLDGEPFGAAGSSCRSTNPIQPRHPMLGRSGGGFNPIHEGAPIMATPARIPSVLPVFIARASFIAPSTEPDSDFEPSLTVELGCFASQHQADAAVASALAHAACIAAKARLEVRHA